MKASFYSRIGKRWFDIFCSFFGLMLLAPAFLIFSFAVFITSGAPIFFRQERTGRYGKPFRIWKFRTMTGSLVGKGTLLTAAGDARVTRFGRWLRRTKCDELPQLFNVFAGEMSLVGPRPEVPCYTEKYTPRQRRVLDPRPGITGPTANLYISEEELLAQASNKEEFYLSILLPAKLESDLCYARNISFNTDLKLIANTLTRLLVKSPSNRKLISNAPQGEV